FPAYGLAEATLAVSFAPLFSGLTVDVVEADPLESENRAVPVPEGDERRGTEQVRGFAVLGRPLDGIEARIVGEGGAVLAEREVGEIQLRGEAITPGYLTVDGPLDTQAAEGWFATGDIGYLVDGQMISCGRGNDVIILGGRHVDATDVGRGAGAGAGARAGSAASVRRGGGAGGGRGAVLLEPRAGCGEAEGARSL